MQKFLIGMILVVSLLTPLKVGAQEIEDPENLLEDTNQEVVYQPAKDLELELIQKVQNPGDQTIKFEVEIKPKFDSDRVNLTWLVTGPTALSDGELEKSLILKNGENQTHSLTILPKQYGVVRVRVLVEAFTIEGARTSIASQAIITDEEGKLLIVSNDQKVANVFYTIRNVSAILLGIFFIVLLILAVVKITQRWWDNDKV